MVLDGPNVNSKLPKAARRASGMPWGPRSEGCALEKYPARNIPPARKVPSEPSISIPLGIDRGRRNGVSLLNIVCFFVGSHRFPILIYVAN